MLRPGGKAKKIAENIMKNKGVPPNKDKQGKRPLYKPSLPN